MVADQPHGGILAHGMGLGKTVTMLYHIRTAAPRVLVSPQATLVICPKSVLAQWHREAVRLGWEEHQVRLYHGPNRTLPKQDRTTDPTPILVLSTFDIVRLEFTSRKTKSVLHAYPWDRVVLDEAHRICEQNSKTARAVHALRAPNRWCITGTPFKNGISDLVALARFVMVAPYCNLVWWRWNGQSASKLREWRRLFLHIRDKSTLAHTLPPKTTQILRLTMSPLEIRLHEWLRTPTPVCCYPPNPDPEPEASQTRPKEFSDAMHTTRDQRELLRILRQRQAANHPLLLATRSAMLRWASGKGVVNNTQTTCSGCGNYDGGSEQQRCKEGGHLLCGACSKECVCAACLVSEMGEGGQHPGWPHSTKTRALWQYLHGNAGLPGSKNKVVIFSQWTSCLDLIATMLDVYGVTHTRYDGRVNTFEEREEAIRTFHQPWCNVLLTSLGAGGEGVNLTCANYIVLMEPYWNESVEQQAIDRLHRIGQMRPTHVVRLFVRASIEEWVQSIQSRKANELQRLLFERVCNEQDDSYVGTKRKQGESIRNHFRVMRGSSSNEGGGAMRLVGPSPCQPSPDSKSAGGLAPFLMF